MPACVHPFQLVSNRLSGFRDLDCPLWIARYGKNTGAMDVKYRPQLPGMIGWQYTSKGRVNGIAGDVDMDVWYEESVPAVFLFI